MCGILSAAVCKHNILSQPIPQAAPLRILLIDEGLRGRRPEVR